MLFSKKIVPCSVIIKNSDAGLHWKKIQIHGREALPVDFSELKITGTLSCR